MLRLTMRRIWVFPFVLKGRKNKCFRVSGTKFGRGFKVGAYKCYIEQAKKFC